MTSTRFLRGSEKYYAAATQRQESERQKTYGFRIIERANEVSVFNVLEDFFDLYLPREGESYKSRCPFGDEHEDGGLDKGWRTYPATNSSFCFPMHGFMPPVRLVSLKYSERPVKSAERILRHYDLLRPKHFRHRYNDLLVEKERRESQQTIGNPQHAVEALNMALAQIPAYTRRQFDADVMGAMEAVLGALNEVIARNDPDVLREWYRKSMSALTRVIEREPHEA